MLYRHHSCTDKGEVARTRLNILLLDAFGGALMCLSKDLFLKDYLTNLFSFYMKYRYVTNVEKTCSGAYTIQMVAKHV